MGKVVNSDDLREWIGQNEYEESEPPPTPGPDSFELIWPTPGPKIITQWYGINPQWYAPFGLPGHEGLDLRALNGTTIFAMAKGEVIRVETDAGSGPYGIHVRVKHDFDGEEYRTVYAHFQTPRVSVGDIVEAGEVVGLSDNTGNSSGPHLHFTLKHIGKGSPWMNVGHIVNPVPYMPDLFPKCTIEGYSGAGWRVDVGGNFRTQPFVADNLIRYLPAGATVEALDFGGDGGDWWQVSYEGIAGWFWNPGYKLSAV